MTDTVTDTIVIWILSDCRLIIIVEDKDFIDILKGTQRIRYTETT